jgi:hypothetical protein
MTAKGGGESILQAVLCARKRLYAIDRVKLQKRDADTLGRTLHVLV